MASALLTKSVESQYSGTGKIIKRTGKLNFSSTETYKCMRGIVKIINVYQKCYQVKYVELNL